MHTSSQAVEKVPGLFRQPEKMPILLRRTAAQKSALRLPEALPSKASGAFDPTRGGLPLELPRLNWSGFISAVVF